MLKHKAVNAVRFLCYIMIFNCLNLIMHLHDNITFFRSWSELFKNELFIHAKVSYDAQAQYVIDIAFESHQLCAVAVP